MRPHVYCVCWDKRNEANAPTALTWAVHSLLVRDPKDQEDEPQPYSKVRFTA